MPFIQSDEGTADALVVAGELGGEGRLVFVKLIEHRDCVALPYDHATPNSCECHPLGSISNPNS